MISDRNPETQTTSRAAPPVTSASSRTDIPAFQADRFFSDFGRGFFEVPNPCYGRISIAPTDRIRCVVFWTRNPEPVLPLLPRLKDAGCYFLVTVTDYEKEDWEPGMAETDLRISRFLRLSERIGPHRANWRFDPIILSDRLDADGILERILRIAIRLKGATRDPVFSLTDIGRRIPAKGRSADASRHGTSAHTAHALRVVCIVMPRNNPVIRKHFQKIVLPEALPEHPGGVESG